MSYAIDALVVVGLLEAGIMWWLVRGLRRLERVDQRLSHLTEALRLLAETTEAGFKASAHELSRVAERASSSVEAAAPPAPKPRPRRTVAAVRKERPQAPAPRAAAAPGDMSESELRLRRHLADTGVARAALATKENGRVALRA
jgi:hypothetical protein